MDSRGRAPPHTSVSTTEAGEPPLRTPALPLASHRDAPDGAFLVVREARLGDDGLTPTIQRGLYDGHESSMEEGDDSNNGGSDGDSDGSDTLRWPPELLHIPRCERRRPLPKKVVQEDTGASRGVQTVVAMGIAPAQEDGEWNSWVDKEDE
jgi:hypothetical protein